MVFAGAVWQQASDLIAQQQKRNTGTIIAASVALLRGLAVPVDTSVMSKLRHGASHAKHAWPSLVPHATMKVHCASNNVTLVCKMLQHHGSAKMVAAGAVWQQASHPIAQQQKRNTGTIIAASVVLPRGHAMLVVIFATRLLQHGVYVVSDVLHCLAPNVTLQRICKSNFANRVFPIMLLL